MKSEAIVATASGSKYLQQLCKHWSHKFAVEFDATRGTVPLPAGVLTLVARADALTLTLDVAEAAAIDRMEAVVAEHVQRFAFREALVFDWVRA